VGEGTNRASVKFFPGQNALVRCLRLADDTRILPGEIGQSDSDFLLIFLNDRVQEVKKIFFLLRVILRVVYVTAELPHKFDVVHEARRPKHVMFEELLWECNTAMCVVNEEKDRTRTN